MLDAPRVDQLLEELLESGGSPEEVCRSCPQLLPQSPPGCNGCGSCRKKSARCFRLPIPVATPSRQFRPRSCRSTDCPVSPAARCRRCWGAEGRAAEFRLMWKEVLLTNWGLHDVWDGFAELCLFLKEDVDYRRTRRNLLEQYGDTVSPYMAGRRGLACLLLPGTEPEMRQAASLVDSALADPADYVEVKDAYPSFLLARGLADYRQGRYERAAAAMEADDLKVLGPTPALLAAMAQYRLGQKELARETSATAVRSYDWEPARAKDRDAWMAHILRREAKALILP